VHGLLHIADGIAAAGPVWAIWAFVMEHYCGFVKQRAVRSRAHPYASIDCRILEMAQLNVILLKYGLKKSLELKGKHANMIKDKFPECKPIVFPSRWIVIKLYQIDPQYTLLAPRKRLKITEGLRRQLAELIVTRCSLDSGRWKIPTTATRKYIPDHLTEWGRAQMADGGDRIRGYALTNENLPARRTCSFVRVSS